MENKWIDDSLIFPGVKVYIDKLAEGFNLPQAIVIQNMLIRRIAEEDSYNDVYGSESKLLYEFMEEGGELVTGQELYDKIYNMKRKQLEVEYIETLNQQPPETWTAEQAELMKRYKMDPESKDQKKKDNDDIQALIDSGDLILDDNQIQPKDKKSIYEP